MSMTGNLGFGPNTLIEGDREFLPVGRICEGDLIMTLEHGLLPVRLVAIETFWMGRVAQNPMARPICISRGCLGQESPWRDLVVSPDHKVLVSGWTAYHFFGADEAEIPAVSLLRVEGVAQLQVTKITCSALQFDVPATVRAEGVWCEAGLDPVKRPLLATG